jgi:NAD(P)-dependent dehydrogenase (short-subunit alcohol dehydrogenase family)
MTAQTAQKSHWSAADVADQTGRVFVITGATNGIGYEAAEVLASRGASVILASRSSERTQACAAKIRNKTGSENVFAEALDLSSQKSIHKCAERIKASHPQIDVLINNAGVMVPPYTVTEDGFELQFGTNHLGHFALTGLLLENLMDRRGSRVVTVSSSAHLRGRINFDDLESKKRYIAHMAYAQSKIANLLFTYELERRLRAAGANTISVAAHPGWARTGLQVHAVKKALVKTLFSTFEPFLSHDAHAGALPMLRAATDESVNGGEYYGPDGFLGAKGDPVRVQSNALSHDENLQKRLWKVSEDLTKIHFPV